jgi:tricorn protease
MKLEQGKNRVMSAVLAVMAVLLLVVSTRGEGQTKLLRFPDVHGDRVVFTYGGDLWLATVEGGVATRLTSHPGLELFAKFSPDGKWIAFTGQVDGDEQVYVVPTAGGVPRQLTFYPARGPLPPRWGYDNQVFGWTPDGKAVLFRSHRDSWTLPVSRLYRVGVSGGAAEVLPMPESGAGDYELEGRRIVYSPRSRDFRSEKRYGGGQANDLFIFDLASKESRRVTDHPRADRDPMWIGKTIYFNSDRDGKFNLYGFDTVSGRTTQVTTSLLWDVRWPSSDNEGRIVYELNGELQLFEVKAKKSRPIAITVPDEGLNRRPGRVAASSLIFNYSLSPKGERALFSARGDIFTAPIEKGMARNLTNSSGAHDKWPGWSPDGSRIAFISDRTGEEEIWVIGQDGGQAAEQLTSGGKAMRYAPEWSPDGKYIAFTDKDGKVWVLTVADRKLVEIADSRSGQVTDHTWSPRGNYLAFSMADENEMSSIYVWSAADGKVRRVTGGTFDETSPAWDPAGNYLYYLSTREFAPQLSTAEFNYATNRNVGIFALSLRKDVGHPFPAESDEVTVDGAKKPPNLEVAKPASDVLVDFDGIESRVARVPVEPNNYAGLAAKAGHLIYIVSPASYYGRAGDGASAIRIFSFKDRKESVLVDGAGGYSLSADGSKLLTRIGGPGGGFVLTDAVAGGGTRKPVSTAGLYVDRVPEQEWRQIFNEVWRRYRDFFYVPNMHGFDWEAIRRQYEPLLGHVAHRSDLNYVIGEMIAELTVQHAYIDGGDIALPARPRVALPGARFELDRDSGRYRIAKIFRGQNEEEIYRAPLTEIGVDLKVGDYVLAIDGQELRGDDDPYRLLRNRADGPVQLTVNSAPSAEGARRVSYRPIGDEQSLLYLEWVTANKAMVDRLSNGQLGYIHIPDMGANGIREFIKWYYPQLRKQGLVVDVRANGGGNVSRMLIERLRRRVLAAGFSRTNDDATTYPDGVFAGPMVCILNENSASDGDIFPAMFREAGLGTLVGKRSWGGVVGITNRGNLIDGGVVNVPEFGFANTKGEWIIEGYGVDPDIPVENDPKSVIEGRDPQLERAVAEVLSKLKLKPTVQPKRPADAVKSK